MPEPRRKRSSAPSRSGRAPARGSRRAYWWERLDDEELLDLRFRDLRLSLERSPLQQSIDALYRELERRGIRFRPHFWLSEEWFSPDGVPGVAIPFYLAHPRLARLERRFMGEVEGGGSRLLRRILRHESGHAIDTAYRLRRRKSWRRMFGKASKRYPDSYTPRIASRNFVLHLGHFYAQSHPCEDFAETFAVWLRPGSRWRTEYADWPALKKLDYVDELMAEIGAAPALVKSRDRVEPLHDNERTLRRHYQRKVGHYDNSESDHYDARLVRVFGRREQYPGRLGAGTFLRQIRPQLERLLARRTRLHPYQVRHVMRTVTRRARELGLCVHRPRRRVKREAFGLLARILHDFMRRGREHYAL
jgi:hypothetical protein